MQDGVKLEGAELRAFLISLDEFQQMFRRMERRMRDPRVVEALANIEFKLDTKADFQDKANLEPVLGALTAAKVTARIEREEEHEAWKVVYHDPMNAERGISCRFGVAARISGVCEPSRARWRSPIGRRSRC